VRLHAQLLALVLVLCPRLASAQVETDGSLGPAGVVPGGVLPDGTLATWRIDESLGQRRGGNLFHSFSRFDVLRGGTAGFTADLPTDRILARVNGASPSLIDGRLVSSVPGADLYLMNPRGVVFSSAATLDVQGSVYASSASHLRFSDGATLTAAPAEAETLSVAEPAAWGFVGDGIAARVVRMNLGSALSVPTGRTFSLAGGAVLARGSASGAGIAAPGGRVELSARATPGELPLDAASLDARGAASGELGAVGIGPGFTIDVSDFGASSRRGEVVIRGGAFAIARSNVFDFSGVAADDGGRDIDVEATDTIDVSASNLTSLATGGAAAGAIRLSADSVRVGEAARVGSRAIDAARAGRVELFGDSVVLENAGVVESAAAVAGSGNLLRIRAGSLDVRSGAQVSGTTEGSGRAADVDVEADDVRLSGSAATGPSGLFARSGLGLGSAATGAAGDVRVTAARVRVEDGAEISAQSFGAGAGGSITIAARERASLASLAPTSASINSRVTGSSGGDIAIRTPELVVANGGLISATTNGLGDAGAIRIDARRVVVGGGEQGQAGGAGIFAQSLSENDGQAGEGGDVILRGADTLEVLDGGNVSVSTRGAGDAGAVRIEDVGRVSVLGGTISGFTSRIGRGGLVSMSIGELRMEGGTITTEARDVGAGGEIAIDAAGNVRLDHGAVIGATTFETGHAGTVRLDVGQSLTVERGSQITTQTTSALGQAGRAGDVFVRAADDVRVANGSAISSDSSGTGDAGTIEVEAGGRVRIESGARISSQTSLTGDGGSIDVRARGVELASGGSISVASSGDGHAGSLRIEADGIVVGRDARITSETAGGGAGGDVDLHARREVTVANRGEITARSGGASNAGDVRIDAGDELAVRDGGRITTQADAAFGGNIDLRARKLVYVRDGEITTSVNTGEGNGGNIAIDPKFVVLDGGRIEARANAGNGGNITVTADHFLADVDSAVDASSELGIDGEVQIRAPEANLTRELAQLEAEYLDASGQLARACAARSGQGTFRVVGGATAGAPDAPLESAGDETVERACR
jgi:filamentous hemagglutinin family protein